MTTPVFAIHLLSVALLAETRTPLLSYGSMHSLLSMVPEGDNIGAYCVKFHHSLYGAGDAKKCFYEPFDKLFVKFGMQKVRRTHVSILAMV